MRVFGEILSAQLENLAASPANHPTGRIYFDTVLTVPVYYNGSAWISLTTVSIPATAGGVYSTGAAFSSVAFAAHANYVFGVNATADGAEYKNVVVGTAGTDFAVAHTAGVITLNLPSASAANRGVLTTGTQTIAGNKTFTGATVMTSLQLDNGTAANPTFAFTLDTTTGLYRVGAGSIGVTLVGTLAWQFAGGALVAGSGQVIQNNNGTAVAPAYTFASDTDTGMYRVGANSIGFAVNGVIALGLDGSGLNVINALQVNGGGYFNAKVFTGVLATGATADLSVGGNITGATGHTTTDAGHYDVMRTATGLTMCSFTADSASTTATSVRVTNGGAGNNTYRVIVFWV